MENPNNNLNQNNYNNPNVNLNTVQMQGYNQEGNQNKHVKKKKSINILLIAIIAIILLVAAFFGVRNYADKLIKEPISYKPVIYLYPEEEASVNVKLNINGDFTCTYPKYKGGWNVKAFPDGTLIDKDGKEYYCLFWEGKLKTEYDFSEGFVVKGEDTEDFLEDSLKKLGLTDKEANEFIIYWLPQMEHNKYNLISFQQEEYTDNAKIKITPQPDSILRVFMAYKPLEKEIDIPEQRLESFERKGFTVVEWGGTNCK